MGSLPEVVVVELESSKSFESLGRAVGHAVTLVLGNSWAVERAKAWLDALGCSTEFELSVHGSEEEFISLFFSGHIVRIRNEAIKVLVLVLQEFSHSVRHRLLINN